MKEFTARIKAIIDLGESHILSTRQWVVEQLVKITSETIGDGWTVSSDFASEKNVYHQSCDISGTSEVIAKKKLKDGCFVVIIFNATDHHGFSATPRLGLDGDGTRRVGSFYTSVRSDISMERISRWDSAEEVEKELGLENILTNNEHTDTK